jgi:hypothetical protein
MPSEYTQSEFEAVVFDRARRAIATHCDNAVAARAGGGLAEYPRVILTITSIRQVLLIDAALRQFAIHALGENLAGEFESVEYVIDPELPSPGFIITIVPDLSAGAGTRPSLGHPPIAPTQGPTILFALRYGTERPLTYRLRADEQWLALGRNLPDNASGAPIRLPELFRAIPRGGLLCLRFWAGAVELLRTQERDEYMVTVDGAQLPADQAVVCQPEGVIEYRRRSIGAYSILTYQVRPDS